MEILPSNKKNIIFNKSFHNSFKEEIYKKIIEEIKELKIISLFDLSYNYSSEGGFELPKTLEWCEYLNNHPNKYIRGIHNYQSTRQLIFDVDPNNNIFGMHCKDGINIFTDRELDLITFIVNLVNY
jgi:hypothetical protein